MAVDATQAAESPWVERLARFGLVTQGVSFMLVGVLAVELALGEGGKATDREGALRAIAEHGVGRDGRADRPDRRLLRGSVRAGAASLARDRLRRDAAR